MTVPAGGEPQEPEGQSDEQLPEPFRRRLDQLKVENKAKDDLILDMAFRHKGLDITKGIGKTARENYTGELTDEAIGAYLRDSYEMDLSAPAAPPAAVALGQQIGEAQARIQDAGQGSGTQSGNNEATLPEQIDQAEAKGDWKAAMALKKEWFGRIMFGGRS